MKKEYQKPFTLLVKMETEGDFLMDSAHSTQHEGFSNSNTTTRVVDDGTDDNSPF